MTETIRPSTRFGFSGTTLKYIACGTMLLDHIGASCIESRYSYYTAAPSTLVTLDLVLRLIGRLAFPIFCFLLVEGFLHTHDVRRYFLQLLGFGLVSELPFDLAFFHSPFYRGHQNVYWTLFFGLCALGCLRHCGEQSAPGIFSALALAVLAELLRTDYGAIGVLLIVVLYITRASRPLQCLFGAVAVCYELPAPLAFLPVSLYNGQRGRCSRAEQWAFYLFYPAHLALLAAVTNLLL